MQEKIYNWSSGIGNKYSNLFLFISIYILPPAGYRNKYFKLFLFISIYFCSFLPSYSQHDSLLKYLELAARKNPAVIQKYIEYQASLQKIPQAGSLSDPQLDIGVFLTPMELLNGNQTADIRLMQMFPWFGVLRNAKDEMSQMANAKFEQFRDAKLQVFYDVQQTWNELYRIRKGISISGKNLDILNVIERLALIRYKTVSTGESGPPSQSSSSGTSSSTGSTGMQAMPGNQGSSGTVPSTGSSSRMQEGSMSVSSGRTGLSDLYRIQIESGDLRNNIELLKNQEKTIIARFNSYLNRPALMPVFTTDTLFADTLDIPLLSVTDSITANNPMLKMIGYEKKSYGARKKMVKGMGYPMIGIGMNYSLINSSETAMSPLMNGRDMIMPMMSITLPVYRKKYNAMKKEAELLGTAAEQNYHATANSLQNEYYQALQKYEDAIRRVKLYEEQYQLASKSLEIVLRGFSATSSDLTDVLRIRQQTLDYELNKIEAVADLNTSVAWLKRLMSSSQLK